MQGLGRECYTQAGGSKDHLSDGCRVYSRLGFFHFGLRTQNFQKNGLACRILKFDDKKCRILQIYNTKCRILEIYEKKNAVILLFASFIIYSCFLSILALTNQPWPLRPAWASEASLGL